MSTKLKILFVCRSNLVRSPMAAAICTSLCKSKDFYQMESAGALVGKSSRMQNITTFETLASVGIKAVQQTIRSVDHCNLAHYKLLVYLDEESHFALSEINSQKDNAIQCPMQSQMQPPMQMLSEFRKDSLHQDIPDPIENGISFMELYKLLLPMCEGLVLKYCL